MKTRRRLLVRLAGIAASGSVVLSGCAPAETDVNGTTSEAALEDAPLADKGADEDRGMIAESTADGAGLELPAILDVPTTSSSVEAPLEVRVSARNDTAEPLELLLWNTPFESALAADLFDIVREEDGMHLAYLGPMVKRALPPPADAVVTLAPGESIDAVIDLSQSYALERAGSYTVRLDPLGVPTDMDGRALATLVAGNPDPIAIERF